MFWYMERIRMNTMIVYSKFYSIWKQQLKQYLPNGVRNNVSSEESAESGICQKPELASSFVNTWALVVCARVCSTAGRRCHSRHTLLLSFIKSAQMRTLPSGVGTTTILVHQSIGTLTFAMTPSRSILSISA